MMESTFLLQTEIINEIEFARKITSCPVMEPKIFRVLIKGFLFPLFLLRLVFLVVLNTTRISRMQCFLHENCFVGGF